MLQQVHPLSCQSCNKKYWGFPTNVSWCPDCISLQPYQWFDVNKKSRAKYEGYKYFLTFTRNPNGRYDHEQWLTRVKKELLRATFTNPLAVLENIETNIHCHAVVEANKPISKTLFKVFIRDYGFVDVRRINVDNGVVEYMSKELARDLTPLPPNQLHLFG